MKLQLLKALIEAACSDGSVNEEELLHLRKKASEFGVSEDDLQFMIQAELARVKSLFKQSYVPAPDMSGFIATIENQNTEQASGFVTEQLSSNLSQSQQQVIKHKVENGFTEETTLSRQGAMSIVQKAKYHGRWVIVKRIKPEYADMEKYRELFFKEFENSFHLEHQHIVRLYGKGKDENGEYYFMEFIDGRPLTELITAKGLEDNTLRQKIALQILDALSYVHKKQIFHRDLKPDNILITYKGDNVKIVDFGLAAADSFEDDLITVGTPLYAAPEQDGNGMKADQRSDIYAFGLIFLEMFVGKPDIALIGKVEPQHLQKIITKCLQPKPEERFDNCDQIIELLTQTSEPIRTIPNWLEEKVRQYAEDGIITRNEQNMLDLDAQAHNIDTKVLQALIDVELEKATERLAQQKEAMRLQKEREKQLEKERKEREKQDAQTQKATQEKLNQLKRNSQPKYAQEKPKKQSLTKWAWGCLVTITIIILLSIGLMRGLKQLYYKHIHPNFSGVQVQIYYINSPQGLNLREQKSTDAKILASFPDKTEVLVYEIDDEWAKVNVDGIEGYMSVTYLVK